MSSGVMIVTSEVATSVSAPSLTCTATVQYPGGRSAPNDTCTRLSAQEASLLRAGVVSPGNSSCPEGIR